MANGTNLMNVIEALDKALADKDSTIWYYKHLSEELENKLKEAEEEMKKLKEKKGNEVA